MSSTLDLRGRCMKKEKDVAGRALATWGVSNHVRVPRVRRTYFVMPRKKRRENGKINAEKASQVKAARAARAALADRAEPEQVRRSRGRHVLHLTPLAPRLQIDQDELVRFIAVLDEQAVPELACHVVPHVDVHVNVPCLVETTTGFWIPEF